MIKIIKFAGLYAFGQNLPANFIELGDKKE